MAPLTKDQLESYQEQGFILLPGLLGPAEVATLSAEYDQLFKRQQEAGGELEARWGGDWDDKATTSSSSSSSSSVLSIHNLQQHSAEFSRLLLHPGLGSALGSLVEDSVVLHHTKAHLKPPLDGAPFPTHQDYHYFPYTRHSMLAVFIHLDDTTPENGGLGVFPGSHHGGPRVDASTSPGVHYLDQEEWPIAKATPVTARPGDVLIFSYLLVHGSYPNLSDRTRRMFLVQVASGSDTPASATHCSPGAGMVLWGTNTSTRADLATRHSS